VDNAPPAPLRAGTPFPHCLGAAAVWYIGFIALRLAIDIHADAIARLAFGLVPWLLSALLVWLVARTRQLQPWLLIAMALPYYAVLWLATNFTISMLAALLFL
jgi:hypothetical protein